MEDIYKKYKIGGFVRGLKKRGIFDKGAQKLSNNIYKIVGFENARAKLENITNQRIKMALPKDLIIVNSPQNLIKKKETRHKNANLKKDQIVEYKKDEKTKKFLKKEGI